MRTFVLFSAFSLGSIAAVSQTTPGPAVGDVVQTFTLKNVDGKMVSLSDYREGKGCIVIFTCNHCPYAKAYEQRILDLDRDYKPKGFPVIAINPNDAKRSPEDSYDHMVKRAKDKKYTFPYLHDQTQEVARAFGATRTPHVFVLHRKDDKWVIAYIGAIDDNTEDAGAVKKAYVRNAVDALLQGNQPEITQTKAIGCTIKWKS